ncbi:hypothetical protein KP509_10G065500 [Ceratopteris richardii]|uniref:Uncharacterized protein n=1 Tax=Ceratopteris richardii TaxID=49495 RepID=A0A8T2TWL7_CERRI|nr:hypothetical protein KP509_10G065500 [Ceratopteris richardii]
MLQLAFAYHSHYAATHFRVLTKRRKKSTAANVLHQHSTVDCMNIRQGSIGRFHNTKHLLSSLRATSACLQQIHYNPYNSFFSIRVHFIEIMPSWP